MARRIDYYDDPGAPAANSLVPSVNVVVTNDAGQILMIKRSDNDNWAIPGGGIELGESLTQAAIRETHEETGDRLRDHRASRHLHRPEARHPLHQRRRSPAGILDRADRTRHRRNPTPSSESTEVHWIDAAQVTDRPMDRSMRMRIERFLSSDEPAVSGLTSPDSGGKAAAAA